MKNQQSHTSQAFDRKNGIDHKSKNPRANKRDLIGSEILSYAMDKRKLAREEHTNHFSNRETD